MSKEQQLGWIGIPDEIRSVAVRHTWKSSDAQILAREILQAIKPIVEKAYSRGYIEQGAKRDYDFETYWNSLTTKDR